MEKKTVRNPPCFETATPMNSVTAQKSEYHSQCDKP